MTTTTTTTRTTMRTNEAEVSSNQCQELMESAQYVSRLGVNEQQSTSRCLSIYGDKTEIPVTEVCQRLVYIRNKRGVEKEKDNGIREIEA
ncbi:hypothetical protein HZH66_003483 [Vespula vulgaris]|uniref:Uncharacterized protein n=1 Tax=Vespula vulgaris TaxID=7454 RepID=A0A834KES6_VESVU|nr:hypothetical protein HZH66_003483 [Vespula vulgaris]